MTYEQKVTMYRAGQYRFKCPPVCTAFWDTDSWIKWIDACGAWVKPS